MLESVDVYTGDGSELITPKVGQKLWPVQYDSILNVWVTKDTAGLVIPINPPGGGGSAKIFIETRTEDENIDFTINHGLNLANPNNVILGIVSNASNQSLTANILDTDADNILAEFTTGGVGISVSITVIYSS